MSSPVNPASASPRGSAPSAPQDFAAQDDRWLKASLQASLQETSPSTGVSGQRSLRLQDQALRDWAQWQREQLRPPAARELAGEFVLATGASSRRDSPHDHPRRASWRVAAAGLLALALVSALWWTQRPDPALEELMRLDVLSLIAAGEI